MKGAYALVIELRHNTSLDIKSLGNIELKQGTLVYVGSAMGMGSTSLQNRIRRHFREKKTIHWHIDHLLAKASLIMAIWSESITPAECDIAHSLDNNESFEPSVKGFGSSDCRSGCFTHLFRYIGERKVEVVLSNVFGDLSLAPKQTSDGELRDT